MMSGERLTESGEWRIKEGGGIGERKTYMAGKWDIKNRTKKGEVFRDIFVLNTQKASILLFNHDRAITLHIFYWQR